MQSKFFATNGSINLMLYTQYSVLGLQHPTFTINNITDTTIGELYQMANDCLDHIRYRDSTGGFDIRRTSDFVRINVDQYGTYCTYHWAGEIDWNVFANSIRSGI